MLRMHIGAELTLKRQLGNLHCWASFGTADLSLKRATQ